MLLEAQQGIVEEGASGPPTRNPWWDLLYEVPPGTVPQRPNAATKVPPGTVPLRPNAATKVPARHRL